MWMWPCHYSQGVLEQKSNLGATPSHVTSLTQDRGMDEQSWHAWVKRAMCTRCTFEKKRSRIKNRRNIQKTSKNCKDGHWTLTIIWWWLCILHCLSKYVPRHLFLPSSEVMQETRQARFWICAGLLLRILLPSWPSTLMADGARCNF